MFKPTLEALPLHEADETAWLEATAELVRARQFRDIDADALAEYLTDMARRDRREVYSRLVVLLAHLLKWKYQPGRRSMSWQTTIFGQRLELQQMLESGTLRNQAIDAMARAYASACKQAVVETGLEITAFPETCEWDVDTMLADWADG